ncbi:MAG: class I SAM-dependent methyltransferase family protein [Thermoplasmata archaeon]|jgi:tRNA wybutosine-synthesizing protein 2|nr:class I SAM-dependent methyltransferase family protein [Thermoplasmata archaeon]
MARARAGPVERVRARLRARGRPEAALGIPASYQRVGEVLLLRLSESLRPEFGRIGRAYQVEFGVTTVARHRGPAAGERRVPAIEVIAGDSTLTEVLEHGIRYRFDASRILFSRGNEVERARAGILTQPGETVVDLFAGIGYFVLPALVVGGARRAFAVEENPESYRFLVENLARNRVADRAVVLLGDNRSVELPVRDADRVFLGLLPTSLPWIPLALGLVRPHGTLHVHLVADSTGDRAFGEAAVRDAVAVAGGGVESATARRVKAYGPGRSHVVVDATVTPRAA